MSDTPDTIPVVIVDASWTNGDWDDVGTDDQDGDDD